MVLSSISSSERSSHIDELNRIHEQAKDLLSKKFPNGVIYLSRGIHNHGDSKPANYVREAVRRAIKGKL